MRTVPTRGAVRGFGSLAVVLALVLLGTGLATARPGENNNSGNAEHKTQTEKNKKHEPARGTRIGHGRGNAGKAGGTHIPPGQSGSHTDEPQPPSHADFSGNGANTHGPYDSTRDGSASQNGNGHGKATGKPCAGCVGKADNKNPPGQVRAAAGGNAGYECASNKGIGRTNPAHTSCQPNAAANPEPPDHTPPGENSPDEKPAQEAPPATRPAATTSPTAAPSTDTPATPVSAASTGGDTTRALPRTGSDTKLVLPAGAAVLIAGTALIALARRRATDNT